MFKVNDNLMVYWYIDKENTTGNENSDHYHLETFNVVTFNFITGLFNVFITFY